MLILFILCQCFYTCISVSESEELEKRSGLGAKRERSCSGRRSWNSAGLLRDADSDGLTMCADKKRALHIFFFPIMFNICNVALCNREEFGGFGPGGVVMLHSSLNPIKSPRGSNGCFLCVFCSGRHAVGCGVACSEVKLGAQTHSSSKSHSGLSASNTPVKFCATDYASASPRSHWPVSACTLWTTTSCLCLAFFFVTRTLGPLYAHSLLSFALYSVLCCLHSVNLSSPDLQTRCRNLSPQIIEPCTWITSLCFLSLHVCSNWPCCRRCYVRPVL